MLGNLGLREAQNFLEMADAKRTTRKQMDDPQPCGIAETLVNLDQFHGRNIAGANIFVNLYIRLSVCFLRRGMWPNDRPGKFQSRPVSDCARIQASKEKKGAYPMTQ